MQGQPQFRAHCSDSGTRCQPAPASASPSRPWARTFQDEAEDGRSRSPTLHTGDEHDIEISSSM
jgi:hypothetical protein